MLQQTGHANDGASCCSDFSRVSRLLSWVDYEAVGKSTHNQNVFSNQ
jgi:hypothetical protein